jgi:hypothetical protein
MRLYVPTDLQGAISRFSGINSHCIDIDSAAYVMPLINKTVNLRIKHLMKISSDIRHLMRDAITGKPIGLCVLPVSYGHIQAMGIMRYRDLESKVS